VKINAQVASERFFGYLFRARMTYASPAYRFLLACALLWCALLVAPPALLSFWPAPGTFVYAFFSRICHQWDSHSLHLFGAKFAVCARCFAIYAGFLAGALLAPFAPGSGRRALWAWAAAPMAADALADFLPWYDASLASRLATGGFFGVAAGIALVPLFVAAVGQIALPRAPLSPSRNAA
jgi:uncharacterized membrane protein